MLETEPDFEVVGEAADGAQALSKALELRPDLIVLDNSMPKMTGIEVARSLHSELPDTRIVFLTLDPSVRDAALNSGATSVVLKDAPPSQLLDAIRRAAGRITAPVRPLVAPARPLARTVMPQARGLLPVFPALTRRPLLVAASIMALLFLASGAGILLSRPNTVVAIDTRA